VTKIGSKNTQSYKGLSVRLMNVEPVSNSGIERLHSLHRTRSLTATKTKKAARLPTAVAAHHSRQQCAIPFDDQYSKLQSPRTKPGLFTQWWCDGAANRQHPKNTVP